MHEVVKRIREFSFFVARSADGLTRLFIETSARRPLDLSSGGIALFKYSVYIYQIV
jgi:hypothetical protein